MITLNVLRASRLFMCNPAKWRYGLDVARQLDLPVTTTYNMLWTLERQKWMQSIQEPNRIDGEPGRRLYCLTTFGLQSARAALSSLEIFTS